MIKIWFLCKVVSGQITKTQEAKDEGIIKVNWYSKDQLLNETVYPSIITEIDDWKTFSKNEWEPKYLELKNADF